jgi:hypothetical protein
VVAITGSENVAHRGKVCKALRMDAGAPPTHNQLQRLGLASMFPQSLPGAHGVQPPPRRFVLSLCATDVCGVRSQAMPHTRW